MTQTVGLICRESEKASDALRLGIIFHFIFKITKTSETASHAERDEYGCSHAHPVHTYKLQLNGLSQ
jgi:hypothetical protein